MKWLDHKKSKKRIKEKRVLCVASILYVFQFKKAFSFTAPDQGRCGLSLKNFYLIYDLKVISMSDGA